MNQTPVGISDMALYLPTPTVDLEELVARRGKESPRLERKLTRALSATGQRAMRFPEIWEDSATLAGQAASQLLAGSPYAPADRLRYIAVGTETSVDHSKPISAYTEGMLQRAGTPVPEMISTFQVQHACAGGTVAMMSVAALLQAAQAQPKEGGLIVCSDIARYESPSTAEITQGAGAAAMYVEQDPKLVSFDLATAGFCSRDVDDFFRPLGSITARVKGGYSVQCYHEAFDVAFQDHCKRVGISPGEVLRDTDLITVHVPFYRMAETALDNLLEKHYSSDQQERAEYLETRGFYGGIEPCRYIGNIYAGSAYMSLMFLLADEYKRYGADIVGKRLLFASYGSGNTMIVMSGRVQEGAPDVLARWNLDELAAGHSAFDFAKYQEWLDAPFSSEQYAEKLEQTTVPSGRFYLASIRPDGYREYALKP